MNVPFVDLRAHHRSIRAELDQAIGRVLDRGDFALGEDVERFEHEFAEFCGTQYAIGVDSGLSALELGLRALDVGPGDQVLVPAHTFVATAAAVSFAGATPVLVDVDPATYNMDVAQAEAAITSRTRAILPVHLYGLPADMEGINALAARHNLAVVEDACQAHGAIYKGKRTGSLGRTAAFSFYPTKNLGGCGDAGMVVTDDAQVMDRVRAMRDCGQRQKGRHELAPFNHRLDTIQAAILRVKLRYLDRWNQARRQNAALYEKELVDSGVSTPIEAPDSLHVYHLYVIRTPERNRLQAYLREREIGTGIHYPVPVHLQPYYANAGFRPGQFPVSEQLCQEILSLPMFPEMTPEQVCTVAACIRDFSGQIANSTYSGEMAEAVAR